MRWQGELDEKLSILTDLSSDIIVSDVQKVEKDKWKIEIIGRKNDGKQIDKH